jgi:CRISPR-associated protein Cas2
MSETEYFWVISYDIADDKRRYRVRRLLEGYGQRVQYSVFECELTHARCDRLERELRRVIHDKEDSIRFYPLNKADKGRIHVVGTGKVTDKPPVIYVDYPF